MMDPQVFEDIELSQLHARAEDYHSRAWRAVNICGSSVDDKVELIYSFSNKEELENLRLIVGNQDTVPSISDVFLSTFFFENETHDLYGVNFKGIAIDFGGKFYPTSVPTPMNPASAQAIQAASAVEPDEPAAAEPAASADPDTPAEPAATEPAATATDPATAPAPENETGGSDNG
jgi:hypothetical protein